MTNMKNFLSDNHDDVPVFLCHMEKDNGKVYFEKENGERCGPLEEEDLPLMRRHTFNEIAAFCALDDRLKRLIRNRCTHPFTPVYASGEDFGGAWSAEQLRTVFAFVHDNMSGLRAEFVRYMIENEHLFTPNMANSLARLFLGPPFFPLRQEDLPDYRESRILLADKNGFGCSHGGLNVCMETPRNDLRQVMDAACTLLDQEERKELIRRADKKTSYLPIIWFYQSFTISGLIPVHASERIVNAGIHDDLRCLEGLEEGIRFLRMKGFTDDDFNRLDPHDFRFLTMFNVSRAWTIISDLSDGNDQKTLAFLRSSGWFFEEPLFDGRPFEVLLEQGMSEDEIRDIFAAHEASAVSKMDPARLRAIMRMEHSLIRISELNHGGSSDVAEKTGGD